MYSILGFEVSIDIILAVLTVNTILLVIAIVGFTNLQSQIRELKETINTLKIRQKELQE